MVAYAFNQRVDRLARWLLALSVTVIMAFNWAPSAEAVSPFTRGADLTATSGTWPTTQLPEGANVALDSSTNVGSVAAAGDVNNDGRPDVIIGTPYSGSAYVVFGQATPTDVDLDEINGEAGDPGFKIQAYRSNDYAGWSVSEAGDINKDGYDDVVVGAPYANSTDPDDGDIFVSSGAVYVVFGSSSTSTVSVRTDAVSSRVVAIINDPQSGVNAVYDYEAYNYAGWSVAGGKDVDGDGRSDILLGAPRWYYVSSYGNTDYGAAYVIFGSEINSAATSDHKIHTYEISGDTFDGGGKGGFRIVGGFDGDYGTAWETGDSVAMVEDTSGDGKDEVAVGAPWASYATGAAYVVFGRDATTQVDLMAFDGESGDAGYEIEGVYGAGSDGGYFGDSIANAGDVNGDRKDDLIVGAPRAAQGDEYPSGGAFVIYGKSSKSTVDAMNLAGKGFSIWGPEYAGAGTSVDGGVDFDGGGRSDVVVGTPGTDDLGIGSAYVISSESVNSSEVDLAEEDGSVRAAKVVGVSEAGVVGGNTGEVVAMLPDMSGDGRGEAIANAFDGAYVVYGYDVNDTAPPNTTITAEPDPVTSLTSAAFEFESSEDESSFECSLDGDAFEPCASGDSWDVEEGPHTFEVRAIDRLDNVDPTPASYAWTVDLTAPRSTIDAKPADPSNDRDPTFEFHATDDSGIKKYQCLLQSSAGGSASWTDCTSPRNYLGLSGGTYTFTVRAIDLAGNAEDTGDGHSSYTWKVDLTKPAVSIDSGPDSLTAETSAAFVFHATDDDTVERYECSLDEHEFELCVSPTAYSGLEDGWHTFAVRAIDRAGNVSDEKSYDWTVDTTDPDTNVTSYPEQYTTETWATFEFESSDWPVSFNCELDGVLTEDCLSPWVTGELPDGTHTFRVWAIDGVGHVDSSPATYTWTIDTKAPSAEVTEGPGTHAGDTVAAKDATFAFRGSTDTAGFDCRLDGDIQPAECGGALQIEESGYVTGTEYYAGPLDDGNHTFAVRAVDRAGNRSAWNHYSWRIASDGSAPTATIESAPANPTNRTTAAFIVSTNEEGASLSCQLDSGDWAGCNSIAVYMGLAEGSHTFAVKAKDRAGNEQQTATQYTWSVDLTPPETELTAAPPSTTTNTSATFEFGSSEKGASFRCALDAQRLADCTSPMAYNDLASGDHIFKVQASDAAGNADPSPIAYRWRVQSGTQSFGASAAELRLVGGGRTLRPSRSGKIKLRLACFADEVCKGDVRIASTDRRSMVLARGRARIGADKMATVEIKLTRHGSAALKRRHTVTGSVEARTEDNGWLVLGSKIRLAASPRK